MAGAGFLGQLSLLGGPCHLSPGPFLQVPNFDIVAHQCVLLISSPFYLVIKEIEVVGTYVGKLQPQGQNVEETDAVPCQTLAGPVDSKFVIWAALLTGLLVC